MLSRRAKVRWCCSAMAGPNCPTPGGTRSAPSRQPASMSSPPTCAASAGPARPPTSAPTRIFHNVGDMVALVAALGEKQAVIVGHDWGAPVAWHAAMFRPDIFTRVAGLSVPPPFPRPRPAARNPAQQRHHQFLLAVFSAAGRGRSRVRARRRRDDANRAGRARVLRPDGPSISSRKAGFLAGADPNRPLPGWLTEADLAHFAAVYQKSGFRGGPQLVSQHRPQLGTDRAVAGRADPPALPVHRGIEGWRHYRADRRQAGQRDGARAARTCGRSSFSTAPVTGSSRSGPTRSTPP